MEDAQLTMRVKTALLNDPLLGGEDITVTVSGGVVRLSGWVESDQVIADAERAVRRVEGVRDVTVSLEVGPRGSIDRERPGRLSSLARASNEPLRLIGLGVSGTFGTTTSDVLGRGTGVGPIVRLRPRNGWGPTVGFSWTTTKIREGPSGQPALATLRVRPVMAGIEYGVSTGRIASSLSVVGGYAFNSLVVDSTRLGPGRAISVSNSFAARAGVSFWYDLTRRLGLNVFTGYRFSRPHVTFASDTVLQKQRVNADAVMVSAGFAYWLF